jgi:methylated-DNA-[protein]-cysteine S-methyltransferase
MDAGVHAREFDRLGRTVQIGEASGRVISVSFPDSPPADAVSEHALLDRIAAYLDGEEDHFDDVTVALTVPTDQRRVLEAVRKVPYGRTVDVERIARLAGLDDEDESDVQTVRTALRENPVPLFIPDHRVSDASGATPTDVARRLRAVEAN